MANNRLNQIQEHLGPSNSADPTRVDGHVIIITGAAQGNPTFLIYGMRNY